MAMYFRGTDLMKARPRYSMVLFMLLGSFAVHKEALALAEDRELPIHIEADAAVIDDAKGSSIYRGNVIIEQGTLLINADEIEVITADQEVIQIIAMTDTDSDKLAHYEQLPDDSEDRVFADARKIVYLVQEERVHLSGNGTLKQAKDVLKGELIYYDVALGIMSLKSTGKDGRIKMTINPKDN
jgi:lipopolysaccharide export system protein LptA